MDHELLAHFLQAHHKEIAGPDNEPHLGPNRAEHSASSLMTHIVERLSAYPAMVVSRFGEVLLQTRPAIALFGDYTRSGESSRSLVDRWFTDPAARERYLVGVGVTRHHHLNRYRHAELGVLKLYRQFLVDPVNCQMLLIFMAAAGSPSDEKLRLLAAAGKPAD